MCRFIQYIVLYASFCAPYYQLSPLAPVRDENGKLKLYPTPNESLVTNPLCEIQNNQNSTDEYGVIGSAA